MDAPFGTIDSWIASGETRSSLTYDLKRIYELQGRFLFRHYEPFRSKRDRSELEFIRRVDDWISSFPNPEDRWSAFNSLRYFVFVGPEETAELYRVAVENELKRWLVDVADIDIFAHDAQSLLAERLQVCWPCPVTDSLRINSLLHMTGLVSKELRPDWYSLRKLGAPEAIRKYVDEQRIEYLVLFEDFVGSGGQCLRTLKFALEAFEGPVFFSPLVVCAPGHDKFLEAAQKAAGRLTYRPVVVLASDCLVQSTPNPDEPRSFQGLRHAMRAGYELMGEELNGEEFGWKGVGCLYSSYSNCPNNTPPIFQHQNENWKSPIFPRLKRV